MSKVIVIGAGAAGMMAAISAANCGHTVEIYDKNEKTGKKIYITGKGRCNVTNACDTEELFGKIVTNPKFLYSAIYSYDNNTVQAFFEAEGCPLKIERGNRVFPVSDKSNDIIKGLEKAMNWAGVKVQLNANVENIVIEESLAKAVVVNGERYDFDRVVVATGGISYASTGSDGDGYEFAKSAGHTIVEPVPSLCAIKIFGNECKEVEGLSLKNVTLTSKLQDKVIYKSEIGEMLFTSNGISGPIVLTTSSYINRVDFSKLKIYIDFKPALSVDALLLRIDRDIADMKAKQVSSLLEGLLPKSMVALFLKRLNVEASMKANQLNREKRKTLVDLLKNYELLPISLESFNQAVVTAGGVNLKEINPKYMKSKLVPNLYFVGEVLDIDALTGGFNLQLAFSTAVTCASDFN